LHKIFDRVGNPAPIVVLADEGRSGPGRMTSGDFAAKFRRQRIGGCDRARRSATTLADEAKLVRLLRGKSPPAEQQLEAR